MINFRHYRHSDNLFEGDFLLVRDFLLRLDIPTYSFGFWEHQVTRPSFREEYLDKIGLWFEDGQLIAFASTEESLGTGILCVCDSKKSLMDEMVAYAKENLHNQGELTLLVPDLDKEYQEAAAKAGFALTQERETESIIAIDMDNLSYSLPDGFHITSMSENYDPVQFDRIMRRGFSGDMEERELSPADIAAIDRQFKRPFVNLDLQVIVTAPDKSWAAFCGMWQTHESKQAFIEPVVTDPDYQKMGLGKAVVYEALQRCGKLGSTSAVVFSSLQFYFNLGFRPNSTSTWWKIG